MFDQFKDLYKLRQQAQEMEKQLVAEKVTGESSNGLVRIVINGKHDLLEVQIADAPYDRKQMAESFKDAYTKAQKALEKILMQKFKGMM